MPDFKISANVEGTRIRPGVVNNRQSNPFNYGGTDSVSFTGNNNNNGKKSIFKRAQIALVALLTAFNIAGCSKPAENNTQPESSVIEQSISSAEENSASGDVDETTLENTSISDDALL